MRRNVGLAIVLSLLLLTGCTTNDLGKGLEGSQLTQVATTADESSNTKLTSQVESTTSTTTSTPTTTSGTIKQTQSNVQQAKPIIETQVMNGNLTVHYIDVGQGGSQLIIGSTGKTILIDAGNNDKENVVVQYLKKENVKKIDIVIGTHPDADHSGGLDAVIRNFEIGKVYLPKVQSNTKTFESVLAEIAKKGLKVTTAKAGLKLDWEPDSTVEMVAPIGNYQDANDMSAVVHLKFGNNSFLFTGDAEAESETDLLHSQVELNSDVLLVGHHGSKTSTSQAFLDKVNPSYAVIQSGKGNKYGHPTDLVLKRLEEKGIKIYRNDEQGNIIFTSNGKEISVSTNEWKATTTEKKSEPTPVVGQPKTATPEPQMTVKKNESVYYKNCSEAKAAGAAPLHRGDPGYRAALDRDNDGIACEK